MSQFNPLSDKYVVVDGSMPEEHFVPLHQIPPELLNKVRKFGTPQGTISVTGLVSALKEARDKNRNKR